MSRLAPQLSALLLALYGSAVNSSQRRSRFLTLLKQHLRLQHAFILFRPGCSDQRVYADGGTELGDRLLEPQHALARLLTEKSAANALAELPLRQFTVLRRSAAGVSGSVSSDYLEALSTFDIHSLGGIDLNYGGNTRICLRLARNQSQGDFANFDLALLQLLLPHIEQSVFLVEWMRQLDSERQLYADTIARRAIGICTLDNQGNLAQCNRTAEKILQLGDGICLQKRRIHIHHRDTRTQFYQQVNRLLHDSHNANPPASLALPVVRASGRPDYELVIKSMPRRAFPVVLIRDPDCQQGISIRALMDLYQLTMGEATVAVLMAKGMTIDQVAVDLRVKKNTVRAHLRAMYAKMGVSHQSMLVALVLNSLASSD